MYFTKASISSHFISLSTMTIGYDYLRNDQIIVLFSTNTKLSGFTSQLCPILLLFPFAWSKVLLCDFHREEALLEWSSKSDNGVPSLKDTILDLLRKVAYAVTTTDSAAAAAKNLQNSKFWNDNEKLRMWFSKKWLPNIGLNLLDLISPSTCRLNLFRHYVFFFRQRSLSLPLIDKEKMKKIKILVTICAVWLIDPTVTMFVVLKTVSM